MEIERVRPDERLRIAVLADFDGPHARAWVRWIVDRGHDVHAVSFYEPASPIDGVTLHVLRSGARGGGGSSATAPKARDRLPRGPMRLLHAARYRMAGLRTTLRSIAPDVVHGHFVIEHGFYGAVAGVRPYVVTAWGSDVLVAPERDRLTRQIARWTLRRADAVTSNNAYMAERAVALGARPERTHVVTLGADRFDLGRAAESVNRAAPDASRSPCVISTRAHEALYNIHEIIDACARVQRERPALRVVIAHGGSLTDVLRAHAERTGLRAEFTGYLDRPAFRDALCDADVFVSVPSSDGTSVALLQAMAAGAFPVVSDLPTQREWIADGVNGLLVPPHQPDALAAAFARALDDGALRRDAAERNRRIVEERGLNETQMLKMEAIYRSLVNG